MPNYCYNNKSINFLSVEVHVVSSNSPNEASGMKKGYSEDKIAVCFLEIHSSNSAMKKHNSTHMEYKLHKYNYGLHVCAPKVEMEDYPHLVNFQNKELKFFHNTPCSFK